MCYNFKNQNAIATLQVEQKHAQIVTNVILMSVKLACDILIAYPTRNIIYTQLHSTFIDYIHARA